MVFNLVCEPTLWLGSRPAFNHFINVELKKIIKAEPIITSDIDPHFYIKYLDIYVGRAQRIDENIFGDTKKESTITPNECRLSDLTYSAPIFVDVQYTKGRSAYRRRALCIGRMPVMLRSDRCVLSNKTEGDQPVDLLRILASVGHRSADPS